MLEPSQHAETDSVKELICMRQEIKSLRASLSKVPGLGKLYLLNINIATV